MTVTGERSRRLQGERGVLEPAAAPAPVGARGGLAHDLRSLRSVLLPALKEGRKEEGDRRCGNQIYWRVNVVLKNLNTFLLNVN